MEGLVNKYKKTIEELKARTEFYQKLLHIDDCTEKEKTKCEKLILFYKGKIEAIEEILQGKDINYYL